MEFLASPLLHSRLFKGTQSRYQEKSCFMVGPMQARLV